jgi:hypothetical protein
MLSSVWVWLVSAYAFDVVALFAAGLGVTFARSPEISDISKANWFFGAAFFIAALRVSHWLIAASNAPTRVVWAFFVFGLLGIMWVWVYGWVDQKVNLAKRHDEDVIQARRETYIQFVEERTRRVSLYGEMFFQQSILELRIAEQRSLLPKHNPKLDAELDHRIAEQERWRDKKNEHDADFARTLAAIRLNFPRSDGFDAALATLSEGIPIVVSGTRPTGGQAAIQQWMQNEQDRFKAILAKQVLEPAVFLVGYMEEHMQ